MGNIVFPPLSNKKAEVLLYTFRFSCVCLEVLCVKILFLCGEEMIDQIVHIYFQICVFRT